MRRRRLDPDEAARYHERPGMKAVEEGWGVRPKVRQPIGVILAAALMLGPRMKLPS